MNVCRADLHVHTALSPCADAAMTPLVVVAWAVDEGLDMIAICDHNSAGNVAAAQRAAGDALCVLAGMEVTTAEEAHVVGLFPDAAAALAAAAEVAATLPPAGPDYAAHFGEQLLMDEDGREVGREGRALALASGFTVEEAVALVHRHGGLAVAAHVDRRGFGVVAQLGVFPHHAGFDAVEVSPHAAPGSDAWATAAAYGLPVLRGSDAHRPEEIGAARSALRLAAPTFAELRLALQAADGREVLDA